MHSYLCTLLVLFRYVLPSGATPGLGKWVPRILAVNECPPKLNVAAMAVMMSHTGKMVSFVIYVWRMETGQALHCHTLVALVTLSSTVVSLSGE